MENNRYTFRLYNAKDMENLENLYSKVSSVYRNKSQFLVDCVMRGMDLIKRDLLGVHNIESLNELYEEIRKTQERLSTLIEISENNAKESMANMSVNRKLLASNYSMLLGLSEGLPKNTRCVEAGMYEELPQRLNDILETILDVMLPNRK